jgi:hypothetical protein
MHSTECTNRYTDHRGQTHPVKGTTGGQQGDGAEMMRFRLSQHPICHMESSTRLPPP